MNRAEYIQKLTLLYVATLVLYLFLAFGLEGRLPIELLQYLKIEYERELSELESLVSLLSVLALLFHVSSLYGLLRRRPWAPKVLLFSTAGLYLLSSFMGPAVEHGFAQAVGSLSTLILGALIALLILPSDALNK